MEGERFRSQPHIEISQISVARFDDLGVGVDYDTPNHEEFFQVVINEDLLRKIELFGKKEKILLDKALLNLQAKNWRSGVKVKKLSGIKGQVFEARLDRSRRILFQIRQTPCQDSHLLKPTLIVQDIVEHKHINSGANRIAKLEIRRLNLQPYNRFLVGDVEEEKEINDVETIDLFEVYEDIDNTGLPNGIKYYRFDHDFRQELIQGDMRKFLALSRRQQKLVFSQGPVMLNGGAGTGKTTVLTYKFMFEIILENKVLFITLTRPLSKFVSQLISSLLEKSKREELKAHVVTFNDLCKRIIGSDEYQFPEKKEIGIEDFLKWKTKHPKIRDYDGLALWQEYYGVLKGRCLDYQNGIISMQTYLGLGEKACNFTLEQRPEVYRILRNYFNEKREAKYWDSLDIAQFALVQLKRLKERPKVIICDEVQDFVEVQYALFARIIDPKCFYNLFFGGDIHQSINQSNFRWEDLKTFLFNRFKEKQKEVGEVEFMTRNFRCTSRLIDFANRFISLKERLGLADSDDKLQSASDDFDTKHAPVLLISSDDNNLETTLLKLKGEAEREILVYNENSFEKLKNFYEERHIFTIANAKGLEFFSTLVYNLATDCKIDWRKLLECNNSKYIEQNYMQIINDFNRLYVAITRARRHMIIYESSEEAFKFWRQFEGSFARITTVGEMERAWTENITEEELLANAQYFETQEKYGLAADYYQKYGDQEKAVFCRAMDYRANEIHNRAADLFLELNMELEAAKDLEHFDLERAERIYMKYQKEKDLIRCQARRAKSEGELLRAAGLFENCELYQEAEEIYETLGKTSMAVTMRAKLHEKYEEWDEAAELWNELKNTKRANLCISKIWESKGNFPEAAKFAELAEEWQVASDYWKSASNPKRSTFCLAMHLWKMGEPTQADRLFKKIGEWDKRLEMWKEQGRLDVCAKIYTEKANDEDNLNYLSAAANLYLQIGALDATIPFFDKIPDIDIKMRILISRGQIKEAAMLMEREMRMKEAGDLWFQLEEYDRAIASYQEGESKKDIARCLTQLKRFEEAAQIYIELEQWKQAIGVLEKLEERNQATYRLLGFCKEKMGEYADAAYNYEKAKDYSKAATLYKMAGRIEMTANAWRLAGEFEQAAMGYEEIRKWQEASDCWRRLKEWEKAAITLEKYAIRTNKGKTWSEVGKLYLKAATIHADQEEMDEKAINAFQRAMDHDNLILLFEKYKRWKDLGDIWKYKDHLKAGEYYKRAEEWQVAADEYIKANQTEKAYVLYKKCNNKEGMARSKQLEGNFWASAELWKEIKKWKKALKDYKEHERILEEKEDESSDKDLQITRERIVDCHKEMEDWYPAAKIMEKLERPEEAMKLYRKAGKFRRAAEINEQLKLFEEAGKDWKKCSEWEKSALCFEKAQKYDQAAESWEKAKEWKKALRNWKQVKRDEKVAETLEKLSKWYNAAEIWANLAEEDPENEEYWKRAIKCYEKAGNKEKKREVEKKYETYFREVKRKELENELKKTQITGNKKKEAEIQEQLKNFEEAAKIYEQLKNFVKAAECWEKSNSDQEIQQVTKLLAEFPKELAEYHVRKGFWLKAAEAYESANMYEEAIKFFSKGGKEEECKRIRQILKKQKKHNKGREKKSKGKRGKRKRRNR